jgi:GR25 family glycosyltransferase involved in LPS biosynthesis
MIKSFVITLKDNKDSTMQMDRCLASGKKYNWNIEPFWAIDGKKITSTTFKSLGLFLNPDTKIFNRPGAQGCFLSHWTLWHKCIELDQSIIILESDAVIFGNLGNLDLSKNLIKLHTDRGTKISNLTGKWSKGSHAYALTPGHAKSLIDGILKTEVKPSDKAIGSNFVPWIHYTSDLVKQIRLGSSTTSYYKFS